jgi:lipopolysaccharide export system permease protein
LNLAVIVPVGLLLAIVLTLGRMYHDSEMAALQACGFSPLRLLPPLLAFATVIAAGLAWLSFVQVPRADRQAQLLRQSAINNAQFGRLDAGRFRTFGGGEAVFYAERVDAQGVLHNVFVQRDVAGRMELALADTATYQSAGSESIREVTLFNGHRYEGVPGHGDFRVIEFREHGIPVSMPHPAMGKEDPDTKPTAALLGSHAPSDIAQLQSRLSSPILALVLTLIGVPLSRLRPRQGRYGRVGMAVLVYFVYSNLLTAAKAWIENGSLSPVIGVWWVHALALIFGCFLAFGDSAPIVWRRTRQAAA